MATFIKNVYGKTTDRKLLDRIEEAWKQNQNENGSFPLWWICGATFCTQFTNGYYHVYVPERNVLQGRILRDYRIGTDGQMIDTEKYYAIPTKEDLISWCNDRKIDTTKLFI